MATTTALILLLAAAAIGLVAVGLIIWRDRRQAAEASRESPYAPSSEGEKRCPHCGGGNLSTDDHCLYCGSKLPDSQPPHT
jgi:hypothetical protein